MLQATKARLVIWAVALVTVILLVHRQEAAASHQGFWWWSQTGLAGVAQDWGGTSDHGHGYGDHAVDIAAPAGTEVRYISDFHYNVWPRLSWGQSCASGNGGHMAVIELFGLDSHNPYGVRYIGKAVYRHLVRDTAVGEGEGVPGPGARLGWVAGGLPYNPSCWTGPHLHQGVRETAGGVTLEHLNDINCKPSQQVAIGARCYLLYWRG